MEEQIRAGVFAFLEQQTEKFGPVLTEEVLTQGFSFNGERIPLISQSGIFKPRQFRSVPISITSSRGGPYPDSYEDGYLIYKYCGTDPNYKDNRYLREACRTGTPLVMFYKPQPRHYIPIWPVRIIRDDPADLSCRVDLQGARENVVADLFGGADVIMDSPIVRQYTQTLVMQRIHQVAFRDVVLTAYQERCALCSLKHPELLTSSRVAS